MTSTRRVSSAVWFFLAAAVFAADDRTVVVHPGHPRLLVRRDRIDRLRIAAGLAGYRDHELVRSGRCSFGQHRDHFAALEIICRELPPEPGSSFLYAPAVMHLIAGQPGQADRYTRYIAEQISRRTSFGLDSDDAVVALDLCWDAIDAGTREAVAERLLRSIEAPDKDLSPGDHYRFNPRMVGVAAALLLADHFDRNSPQSRAIQDILDTTRRYLQGPMRQFFQHRGAMPLAPEMGIYTEADAVMAVEMWHHATTDTLWPVYADTLGRCCEHYLYAGGADGPSAPPHGFIHDHGIFAPARPGAWPDGLIPATPFVLAARLDEPAAWRFASLAAAARPSAQSVPAWVPLLWPVATKPPQTDWPLGRDFGGGWVAMRGAWRPGATVVLFDAGQPFLHGRQHFDAGAFQVYRKGWLAIDSGPDISFQATEAKGGSQHLGERRGDFEHYARSTIAHNCLVVLDPLSVQRLGRQRWRGRANQRLIAGDIRPIDADLDESRRRTGRLVAFQTTPWFSYATADLAAAWDPTVVSSCSRQVVLLGEHVLVILDRVQTLRDTQRPFWLLQLPREPRLDGAGLAEAQRVRGLRDEAGVWRPRSDSPVLSVTAGDGRLNVRTLLPLEARWHVVGGPRTPMEIPEGPLRGRRYYGSSPDGYAYRLSPTLRPGWDNAWFRLARPTDLGNTIGPSAGWGRLEVDAIDGGTSQAFLHVMLITDRDDDRTVAPTVVEADGFVELELTFAGLDYRLRLATDAEVTGHLRITSPAADAPLHDAPLLHGRPTTRSVTQTTED